ncbi:MAG: hypothetical protein ABIS18_05265 [Actinomycetota bacterium]
MAEIDDVGFTPKLTDEEREARIQEILRKGFANERADAQFMVALNAGEIEGDVIALDENGDAIPMEELTDIIPRVKTVLSKKERQRRVQEYLDHGYDRGEAEFLVSLAAKEITGDSVLIGPDGKVVKDEDLEEDMPS